MQADLEKLGSGDQDLELTRSLLDKLLTDSRLYTQSQDYKDLLDFIVRMRNFAPFNAMLLQVQKPGLRFAASAHDWEVRFGRYPKRGARPLLILWPFGPVALVYDALDTVGKALPEDVDAFPAAGNISDLQVLGFTNRLKRQAIHCSFVDAGDGVGGAIWCSKRAKDAKDHSHYTLELNQNHKPTVVFNTLAHELGHLYLGHLGADKKLRIPERRSGSLAQIELEAESVAYLVCRRYGVAAKSEAYLSRFVAENTMVGDIDVFQVMRAAGQVEVMLGIASSMKV